MITKLYSQIMKRIDTDARPYYLQVYKQLKDEIVGGVYRYKSRLPSKRLLAGELGVSTITVEHAYALLSDEGYAESRERSGFFVTFRSEDGFAASENVFRAHIRHDARTSEYPSFPLSVLSRIMRRVLADYRDVILEKSLNAGCIELREAIGRYLARNRGMNVRPEQIIIGSGGEYLYGLIINLIGRDKVYAIEAPSYDKLEMIYRMAGARIELLPLADDGIESVALASSKADVLHTTPYRSFPSGVTASASKRHEYIRWSNRDRRLIIESDYGSEFSVSSQPMETLFSLSPHDNVIYLNTFSRTISPSMRVGYMVLPQRLADEFHEKLGFYSCTVPSFEQYVLAELINNGDFERHINRVRRSRRKSLEEVQ